MNSRTIGRQPHWGAVLMLSVLAICTFPARSQTPARLVATTSVWAEQEKERFGAWLAKHPADVLIVPFQSNGKGFDPAERIQMAARLADELPSKTGLTIADPMIAGRALGEGLRTYDEREVLSLADRSRARFVILGVTGHDGDKKWGLTLRVLQKEAAGTAWREAGRKAWDALPLYDEQAPNQSLTGLMPEIAGLLGAKAVKAHTSATASASVAAPGKLPTLEKALAASGPVNVHLAQLVAISYPRTPEAGAERAWIRTLRLAQSLPASAGTKLPIARALMHLGRRPAALSVLSDPKTDAELALREVLNGNLPAATRHAAKINDPVLRLLAQVELRDLRFAYEAATPEMEVEALTALLPEDSDWYPFLELRVQRESSGWGVEHVMHALVRFDPVVGPEGTLSQTLKAAITAAARNDDLSVALARTALSTYDTEIKAEKRAPQDGSAALRWLLLDLFQTQVVNDLLAEATLTISTRDLPDEGHRLLASLDPILRGHPDFEAMRARLDWREYARWRGQQRASWQQLAITHTRDAYRISGRLTRAIENAERAAPDTAEVSAALNPQRIESFWDWPGHITWIPSALRRDERAMLRYASVVMRHATSEYANIGWLMDQPNTAALRPALNAATAGRFDGSPSLVERRVADLLAARDVKGAEEALRSYVSARPIAYGPYDRYLDMLVSQGRHAEAFKMISAYPGFDEELGVNRVTLSNYAAGAGLYFWPIGKFEYAEPLLTRSAEYDTGSARSLTSGAVLSLYRGDADQAARIYMQIARRYSDIDSLNEYFELIFALGRADEAWRVYKEVRSDGNGGRVLSAIARHSRVTGWTDQQTLDWLAAPENAKQADGTFFYAPRAALGAAIIDRDATVDLTAPLVKVATSSPYVVDKSRGLVVRKTNPAAPADQPSVVCGPSHYGKGPTGGMSTVSQVDSGLVYFAKGYRALARQQPAEAFATFDQAARLLQFFDSNCESVSYMLPYLALAAAQTKNTAALRKYLEDVAYRDRNVNYNLALATLAAFDSKHQDAAGYLDSALNRWTSNNAQPLPPEYIYADVLERLFTLTREPMYRDRLVQWARIRQRVSPTDAWAYSMEYRYTQDASQRNRALGMALYLDPRSTRLSGVNAKEAAAAKALVDARNPFLAWRDAKKQ